MQLTRSKKSTTANNKTVSDMSTDEYTRWLCLLEAVELVNNKMAQFGHRLQNQDADWIKALAFQKYIDERYETMKSDLHDLETNEEFKIYQQPSPYNALHNRNELYSTVK